MEAVNGLSYLSEDLLALEVQELCESLWRAHLGSNNFFNEEGHAKALDRVLAGGKKIPAPCRDELVRVVTRCLMGNGYGVSFTASPHYHQILRRFGSPELVAFGNLLGSKEFKDLFERGPSWTSGFVDVAKALLANAPDANAKNLLSAIVAAKTSDLQVGRTWVTIQPVIKQMT